MAFALAQLSNKNISSVLWYGSLLILACAVLWVVVWRLRRWMFKSDLAAKSEVFTLQNLRDMRDEGQINEQEFEVLKAQHLAELGIARPPAPLNTGPTTPQEPPSGGDAGKE